MTDSFAPPWAGPHNDATPAATHAKGLDRGTGYLYCWDVEILFARDHMQNEQFI